MEYRISQQFMVSYNNIHLTIQKQKKDFFEGVRAALVDKDKKPEWNPNAVRDITPEQIGPYFASKDRELKLD
jgi:hypothetical protein